MASGGMFLILFALALPARAGLGDLLGGVLEDPISELTEPLAPIVTSVPLVENVIETTEALTSPVVTVVDSLASPVVTVVDEVVSPLVEPQEEVVNPEVIETPTDPVDLLIEVVDPALEVPTTSLPGVEPEPTLPVVKTSATAARLEIVEQTFDQVSDATSTETTIDPTPPSTENIQRVLLSSIVESSVSSQNREATDHVIGDTGWLSALRRWLESGILIDVLAIPARLLEILLRALFSAGSGLVAPAAILVALAVGGRRRLLPAS